MAAEKIPADQLKLVQRPALDKQGRPVTEKKGKEDVVKMRAIKPDEVLSWRSSDDEIVITTTDGQKFRAAKEA